MTFSPQACWRGGGDGGKREWLGLGEKASKRRGNNCELTFVCITLSEVDFFSKIAYVNASCIIQTEHRMIKV